MITYKSDQSDNKNQLLTDTKKMIPKFTYYKAPVKNTAPCKNITLEQCYNAIAGSYFENITSVLRQIEDPERKRKFKAVKLPFVTFSGIFKHRSETGLLKHSGLMVFDIDHFEENRLLKIRLLHDRFLRFVLLFVSPGGKGLKAVLLKNDLNEENHTKVFTAVKRYLEQTYKIEIDPSGRDIPRVCFLCHDPEALLHPDYGKMINHYPELDEVWRMGKSKFVIDTWLIQNKPKTKITKFQKKINGASNDVEEIILRIELAQIDLTANYNDWIKLGFSFASEFGEPGREYFHRVSRFHTEYDFSKTNEQYNKCLKGLHGSSIKVFFAAARDAGINVKV